MVLNLGTRVFTIVGCKTNREHLLSEVTVTYRKNGFLRGFWTVPVNREDILQARRRHFLSI